MAGALSGYNSSVGGYRPVTFEQFQGLDLKSAPDQAACIDMLNVDITLDGNLRTRDGTVVFSTSDTTASLTSLFTYRGATADQLVASLDNVSSGANYCAVSTTGVVGAAFATSRGDGFTTAAQIGTPAGNFMYLSTGSLPGDAPLPHGFVRYDGTTFTLPTCTVDGVAARQSPTPKYLAASPIDNRLVIAGTFRTSNTDGGPFDVASTESHVWFSDPGLPESYSTTNFVQLTPGDGETIQAAVSWRELVFVFKSTKFFVFYGTSTDSTGKPIFNYRPVAADAGVEHGAAAAPSWPLAVAGSDAVYFANSRGIYRTTGQAPVLISRALDPLFQGGPSPFWQGGTVTGIYSLTWFQERLYVVVATSALPTGNMVLVYDPRQGVDRWLMWQVGAGTVRSPVAFATTKMGVQGLYYGNVLRVRKFSSAATDDAGTAITSRYRSGFGFGGPDETTVRETILDGSGTPTLQWSRDWGSLVTGSAVTLGTAPAISVGRQRIAIRGRRFSWQLGAASGAWSLQRLQAQQRDLRESSVTV